MRYKLADQVEPVGARGFFLYVPDIPYRSGARKLSRQLDRGPLDGSVRQFADLIGLQSKARLNALAVLGAPFSLSLIFAQVTDGPLNLQTYRAGVARLGVHRRARGESATAGHHWQVLHALQKMSCTSSRLSS